MGISGAILMASRARLSGSFCRQAGRIPFRRGARFNVTKPQARGRLLVSAFFSGLAGALMAFYPAPRPWARSLTSPWGFSSSSAPCSAGGARS